MAAAAIVAGALWCLLAKPFRVPDDPMTVSWQVQLLGSQTWDMTPALLWGLAAGVWFKEFPSAVRSRAVAVAGIVVAVVATALVCRGGRNIALENVAGIGCLAFALGRWQGSSWVDRLARVGVLAYGIYLCHILWVQGGRSIARKLGLAPSAPLDVSVFAASTVLSILMAWGLSRSRATRWLVA
jgi:peptidoglycan/LPS O-acetylase OafA/YrhL